MQGVPTALGFIGAQDDVLGAPGLDFDPMAQDPMADPSSAYDVPPLSFDRSQIPKWVQSAKDQLAKSFNTNSLLDNIFSGPNAGLTLDQIEQAEMQANLMGAVDKDLSEGLLGSEDRFAESMQKLQALMGNTPQIPGEAPLGQPDPAASIVSGIVAARTPEHAFDIAAVPHQIEQRKQAEENERLMLEYKNQMLQQEAAINAQKIGVELEKYRLEWEQNKAEIARKAAEKQADDAKDAAAVAEKQYWILSDRLSKGNTRVSDLDINNIISLAKKAGLDPDEARKGAEQLRSQKDLELATEEANKAIQRVTSITRNGTFHENPEVVESIAKDTMNMLRSAFAHADPGALASLIDYVGEVVSSLNVKARQLVIAEKREAGVKLRFEASMDQRKKEFAEKLRAAGVSEAVAERRVKAYEASVATTKRKVDADIAATKAAGATGKGLPRGVDTDMRGTVQKFREIDKQYNDTATAWTKARDELAFLEAKGSDDEAVLNRMAGLEIEMEGLERTLNFRSQAKGDIIDQMKEMWLQYTSGMTDEAALMWAKKHGVPIALFGVSNR